MKTVECRVDLHNHLAETAGFMPTDFNEVVDYASKRLGDYGILGITSSKSDGRYKGFAHLDGYKRRDLGNAIYIPEKKLWVVNTDEIHTSDGHLLVVGGNEDEEFEQGKSLFSSLEKVNKKGLINILPHPEAAFGTARALKERMDIERKMKHTCFCFPHNISQVISGAEIFNSQLGLWRPFIFPYNANGKFLEFYKENIARFTTHALDRPAIGEAGEKRPSVKVGALAFSDEHTTKGIGTSYTNLTMPYPCEIIDGENLVWHLDGAIRSSQLIDRLDDKGKVIERFADFNGKMGPARWGAFKHCVKSSILALAGMK